MGTVDKHEVHSLLAKILAAENLNISHENIPTAFFDLEKRVLHLPNWVDGIENDLYTMLVAHEVGHALYTPLEGWHNAIFQCREDHEHTDECVDIAFKGYLNIIEDARQERFLKAKFPGLRRTFFNAAKDLLDRDFFGIKGLADLSVLNLIDRLNLYFRAGAHLQVPFSASEKQYITRMEKLSSWEEVVALARELYGVCKTEKHNKPQTITSLSELWEQIDKDGDRNDEDNEGSYGDQETNDNGQDTNDSGKENSSSVLAVTDAIYHSKESTLSSSKTTITVNLPTVLLDHIIYPLEKVVSYYEERFRHKSDYDFNASKLYKDIISKHKRHIDVLLKTFEMRKNAREYYHQQHSRKGELDVRRLHQYKFTSDIFRQITEVRKGKSHGLILFLDMSSSMSGINIEGAIRQVLILARFCDLAHIPYDVYGFANVCEYPMPDWKKSGMYTDPFIFTTLPGSSQFHLRHLLSSHVPASLRRRAQNMLANYSVYQNFSNGLGLGTTPLVETIWVSRQLIDQFKQENRLDIVNVVYLTDGEGTTTIFRGINFDQCVIVDDKTRKQVVLDLTSNFMQEQKEVQVLMNLVKRVTDCRHLGVYVCSLRDIRYFDRKLEEFIGEHGYAVCKKFGFDNYYLVLSKTMLGKTDEVNEDIFCGAITARQVGQRLIKIQSTSKKMSVLLERFAEEIATVDDLEDRLGS